MSDSFSIPREADSLESSYSDNSNEGLPNELLTTKPHTTNFDQNKPKFIKAIRQQPPKASSAKIDTFGKPNLSIVISNHKPSPVVLSKRDSTLNDQKVDSKPLSTWDAMRAEYRRAESKTRAPKPLVKSPSDLATSKFQSDSILINDVPNSPADSVEIKKIKIKKGFMKFGLEEQNNETTEESSTKVLNLIHDKAFGKYENEKEGEVQKPTEKPRPSNRGGPKFVKMLQKHVKGKIDPKNSLFSVMGRVRKMKENPIQRLFRIIKTTFSCSKDQIYNIKLGLRKLLIPFSPDGKFLRFWEIIIILLLFIDLILLPFTMAFEADIQDSVQTFDTIENIQLALYVLNILVCSHSAYYKDGSLVYSHKKIARNYVSKSFWMDVISSFPYRWVEGPYNAIVGFRPIHLLRFLRVLRVFKIIKSSQVLDRIEQKNLTNPVVMGIMSLFKLSVTIACLAHWCACGWYLLGSSNHSSHNWLLRMSLEEDSAAERYVAALYFAITTMMTVGYGDISPVNLKERLFAIFIMIIGGGVFGYTMNSIAMIIQSLEGEKARKMKKVKALVNFLERKGMSEKIKEEVKQFMKFSMENEEGNREGDKHLLSMLSTNLQEKISREMNGRFVSESPLLQQIFTKDLKRLLSSYLEERIVSPEEMIYARDGSDDAFYFISKGRVNLYSREFLQSVAELKKGDYFGHITFFTGRAHVLQARSIEFSQLIYISRERFLQILEKYPCDKQMFLMIKDKIMLYNNHSELQIKCHICQQESHLANECPKLHYAPKKETIIKKHLEEEISFRRTFIRRNRGRYNAMACVKECESLLESIDEHYEKKLTITEEDEEDEEENKGQSNKVETSIDLPTKHQITFTHGKRVSTLLGADSPAINRRFMSGIGIRNPTNAAETYLVEENFVEEEVVFDTVKNYEVYFPHNNIAKILDQLSSKKKKLNITGNPDYTALRKNLRKLSAARKQTATQEPSLLSQLGKIKDVTRSVKATSIAVAVESQIS